MMGGMWIRGLQPGVTGMLRYRADLGAETQREWGDPFSKRTITIEKGTIWGLDMEQKPQGCSEVEPMEEKPVQSRPLDHFSQVSFSAWEKWPLPVWEA